MKLFSMLPYPNKLSDSTEVERIEFVLFPRRTLLGDVVWLERVVTRYRLHRGWHSDDGEWVYRGSRRLTQKPEESSDE